MNTQASNAAAAPAAQALRPYFGLIFLLILLLLAGFSVARQFPLRAAPVDAPLEAFSAGRALVHLPVIAARPHPAGSPAQAQVREYLVDQLEALGLQVDLQNFGEFTNLSVRLPGESSTGAVVVMSHYDSVSAGPGAADNGSGTAALLEIARALVESHPLRNDVILLFDDAEEVYPAFLGTRAFAGSHPWMADVRVAMSLDTAVSGPATLNDTQGIRRETVRALSRAYRTGWTWNSAGGDGTYDSFPFKASGAQTLDLEDNYAFRVQHTRLDTPEIVQPGSLQQLGEQALAITCELAGLDLSQPPGEAQTFFFIPLLGLVYYPQAWDLHLAIAAGTVLLLTLGFALLKQDPEGRKAAGWRGLAVGLAASIAAAAASSWLVGEIWKRLPRLLGWKTSAWPEWPQIVPPGAGWILAGCLSMGLLVGLGLYRLARRWSSRSEMALAALIPFAALAIGFVQVDRRLAFLPTWPALIGAAVWLAFLAIPRLRRTGLELPAWIGACLFMFHWPFTLVNSFLSSGPSDLPILALLWGVLIFILLPAIEGAMGKYSNEPK